MNIGIIGLGKLGLPMLSAFIKKGFNAKGFDINSNLIELLKKRIIPIKEDGLVEIMNFDKNWCSRFTDNLENLYDFSDVIFIIVPTPSNNIGTFNSNVVEKILKECNQLALQKKNIKDVVITSTLNPFDSKNFQDTFKSLNLIYSPEFIALGTVIHDMLNPDICIIGSDNILTAQKVESIYKKLYDTDPQYFHLGFTEAEIAKISINSYITMKITFANIIGALVLKTSNGNMKSVADTLQAIGSDSRINNKYFKFGTGYGGPCFPRDNLCLSKHLESNGINSSLQISTDNLNNWLLSFFKESINFDQFKNIVYVGISYKKGSDFLEESFVLKLHELTKQSNKKYYFIDDKVEKFENLIKINDATELSPKDTLYLLNYANTKIVSQLKDKNVFNFWTFGEKQ